MLINLQMSQVTDEGQVAVALEPVGVWVEHRELCRLHLTSGSHLWHQQPSSPSVTAETTSNSAQFSAILFLYLVDRRLDPWWCVGLDDVTAVLCMHVHARLAAVDSTDDQLPATARPSGFVDL